MEPLLGRFTMRANKLVRLGQAALMACMLMPMAVRAEPLATAGVGVQSCEKLAPDIKPEEGFNNMANALVYYWAQGYMSAANMALLEGDSQYVDLSRIDEKKLLPMILDYCLKNPAGKPITVLDRLITDADKLEGKWKSGTIPWAADDDK